ncbi:MAG: DUF2829 domain-containing protein [Leptospira sp.]|jgi:hypothetical protein|nr:DUF2829 domain-containing protein [Leptospira sp.]
MEDKLWENWEDDLEELYWKFDQDAKKKNLSERDVFKNKVRWFINKILSVPTTFGFEQAIRFLKEGKMVARIGWNGKGMWLKLVAMDHYSIIEKAVGINMGDGHDEWNLLPWIGMKTADDKFVPWLASQTDMLAEDWILFK